ncbi:hypothetical protein QWY82_13980, partial [Simiduia curdlanivorans]|uniref:hypothetical protein n=1 Tax=Simiduia curdlanivorans TaxID=1492769 RepID=UPI0025B312A3
ALLTLTAVALCPACLAGETFSQTFYTGEDSALEQATTQAIHFQHYANLPRPRKSRQHPQAYNHCSTKRYRLHS